MWRAFGGTGTRVGIVLRFPYVSISGASLALNFSPVAYLSEAGAHGVSEEVIANAQANRDYLRTLRREVFLQIVFQMFVSGIVCLEHEGFYEEPEWRAIYAADDLLQRIGRRSAAECHSISWPMYGAFVEDLKATGVTSADESVFVSGISIRA